MKLFTSGKPRFVGGLVVSLFFPLASQAAVTTYSSEADFLSALNSSAIATYNFDNDTAGDIYANGSTASSNGINAVFSYSLTDGPEIEVVDLFDTTSPENYLGTNDGSGAFVSGDGFTLTFDQTIRAIGLHVVSDVEFFDSDFTITTSTGQSVSNLASANFFLGDGSTAAFLGLTEDDMSLGFTSITLTSVDAGFLFNVDDITAQVVPLPGTAWLFFSALFGAAGIRFRAKPAA